MRRGWSLGNLVKKTQFSGNLKKHRPKHWSQMYMFVVSGALALGPRGNQPIPIRGQNSGPYTSRCGPLRADAGIQKIVMVYTNHPFAKLCLMLIREDPTLDEDKERASSGV